MARITANFSIGREAEVRSDAVTRGDSSETDSHTSGKHLIYQIVSFDFAIVPLSVPQMKM